MLFTIKGILSGYSTDSRTTLENAFILYCSFLPILLFFFAYLAWFSS